MRRIVRQRHRKAWSKVLALGVACVILLLPSPGAKGQGNAESEEFCFMCHASRELTGEGGRSLFVDQEAYLGSVHGQMGFGCTSCHTDADSEDMHSVPLNPVSCGECHAGITQEHAGSIHKTEGVECIDCHGTHDIQPGQAEDSRTQVLNIHKTCGNCHFNGLRGAKWERVVGFLESAHARGLEEHGLTVSATCTSCHGAHKVVPTGHPDSPVSYARIPRTCGQCHGGILNSYLRGVHGSNFLEGISDVPVCTTCHGEHDIAEPERLESRVYRTKVARVCAQCHDNEELMARYNVPAGQVRSFQDSIHGIALEFGSTRVANCASCHGFHDILPSVNTQSSVHPDNLPQTCGQCHEGAGVRFAGGRVHLVDLKEENFIAYLVTRAYQILIAGLLAGFILYISADLWDWIRRRRATPQPKSTERADCE